MSKYEIDLIKIEYFRTVHGVLQIHKTGVYNSKFLNPRHLR